MFEQLGARARASVRHGVEGAERLRGAWLSAGRQAYGDAIREGREVVARTESEIEALGRQAIAETARLKAAARKTADDAGRRVESGRVQLSQAVGQARRGFQTGVDVVAGGVQRTGRAAGGVLEGMGRQVSASQPMEREIVRATAPAARNIVGKTWNAPNTLIGLAYGGAGHVAGMAAGTDPYVTVDANAIQFRNNPFGGVGAVTLGNTTTYDDDPSDPRGEWAKYNRDHAAPIWEHERQHTIQGELLGPLYLPSNMVGGAWALARDGDWHGPSNWNERGPQETSPQPWPSRGRR